ncbi:hypothetical protein GCM10008986_25810 [Salinibacillus aidingensis]|uniref:Uncharacterized protein n=1 Tax=Salinibacillus aidingensis TaxID=237684 RepID=A0ABP3LHL0_9BACI
MKQLPIDKIKTCTLIVLALLVLIGEPILYQEKAEDKRDLELLLNHFYHELDRTISAMDYTLSLDLDKQENQENFIRSLYSIEKHLERTGLMLKAGDFFVSDTITYEPIFFINRGITGIGEDKQLDASEATFLRNFKNELETIRKRLYSGNRARES